MKLNYRILTKEYKVKYAGSDMPSWFSLEKAKELVDYSAGEMIYEYNMDTMTRMFEVL